jgi:hypothetical protein
MSPDVVCHPARAAQEKTTDPILLAEIKGCDLTATRELRPGLFSPAHHS